MPEEPVLVIEPERYEFAEPPIHHFEFDRRQFFKTLGGGVAVFLLLKNAPSLAQAESGARPLFVRQRLPQNVGAWLHIGAKGDVTVFTGKTEVGQNIRTSLTQAVAEKLRVPVTSIRLVMADTHLTPFDMGTFGSRTTPQMGTRLRRVASVAREVMVKLAARQWGIAPGSLEAANGQVRDPKTGRTLEYAALARGRTLAAAVVENDPLTPPADWTVAGTSVLKIDGRDFVTGRHRYTPDIVRPGMLYGKVLRPPAFEAKLISLDASVAKSMPGVTVTHEGGFVGAAAPSVEIAQKAVDSMRAQWKTTPQISDKDLFAYLKQTTGKNPGGFEGFGGRPHITGSVESGLRQADHRLEQTYTVAYIAHAPMETRAAVAEWQGGKVTVWTGTQRPFAVRDQVAQAMRIPKQNVRVIVPDTGGAFGGKHTGEAAVEAARLARASGKPVKLQWTREEEFTWAYFRPAGVIEIKSGVTKNGVLTAWEFDNYNSGGAGIHTPYDVPNRRIRFHPSQPPLRQGSYRCLAATGNQFARESHMDDLARLVKLDPLEFRRRNLKNERVLAVLNAAAKTFGWEQRKSSLGRGFGIACGTEKGGYIATAVEVAVDQSTRRVQSSRVVSAFDCGAVVNPNGLKNQIEGAMMMGLGGALFEAMRFDNGRILNGLFSRYRVPRFSDMPKIDVVLIDRKGQPPAGAGESPIMCLAPAIRNAILDATGVRLFAMPLAPEGLKA